MGAELGECSFAPDVADSFLDDAPPLDFTIGSVHLLTASGEVQRPHLDHEATDPAVWYADRGLLTEMETADRLGPLSGSRTHHPPAALGESRGVELDFNRYEEQVAM